MRPESHLGIRSREPHCGMFLAFTTNPPGLLKPWSKGWLSRFDCIFKILRDARLACASPQHHLYLKAIPEKRPFALNRRRRERRHIGTFRLRLLPSLCKVVYNTKHEDCPVRQSEHEGQGAGH